MSVDALDRASYYDAARALADFNLYQTWDYANEMATAMGGRISTLKLSRDGEVAGLVVMRIKTAPLFGWGVAYGLYAPLWRRPGHSAADLIAILESIRNEYGDRRGLSVRLRPRVWQEMPDAETVRAALLEAGFVRTGSDGSDATYLLDLRNELAVIRGGLQRRWRNYLSQGERAGLTLTTDGSDEAFAHFLPLYEALRQRKGFRGIDADALRRVNQRLPAELKLEITLARREGRVLSGHVASHLGEVCLGLLAATAPEGLECRAANVVWWERFKRAKQNGQSWYDLGGVDFDSNRSVSEAKSRLGGEPVTLLGEYRYEPSRARAALLGRAESVYRRLRRLWPSRAPHTRPAER